MVLEIFLDFFVYSHDLTAIIIILDKNITFDRKNADNYFMKGTVT